MSSGSESPEAEVAPRQTSAGERRPRLGLAVKRVVSAALLAAVVVLIARTEGIGALGARLPTLRFGYLALAAAFQLATVGIGVLRWQRLLALQRVTRPLPELTSIYLVGRFVGVVTPGTTGLDVVRAVELGRRTGEPLRSAAAIVVEKVFGVLGLALATALAIGFGGDRFFGPRGLVVATSAAVGALALVPLVSSSKALAAIGRRLPAKLRSRVAPRLEALDSAHPSAPEVLLLAVLSTFAHLATAACYASCGAALDLPVSARELMVVGMVVIAAMLLPISAGGAGVREGAAVIAFRALGVPASEAVLVALLGFLASQPPALLGGLVKFLERERAPG